MKIVKGWKNTNKKMMCRDFKFEVGESYHQDGKIGLCKNGFHFHENRFDIFRYYNKKDSKVLEVEAAGEIVTGSDKSVCSDIKIIKVLTNDEIDILCNLVSNTGLHNSGYRNSEDNNSGDRNSGNSNSGDSNSGYRNSGGSNSGDRNSGDRNSGNSNSGYSNSGDSNSGYRNSGDRNSGDSNSGDWNSGYSNNGFFNTEKITTINIFNKPCRVDVWEKSLKPNFIYFDLTTWVSELEMTEQEKKDHEHFHCTGGYLKTLEYKEAWKLSWNKKIHGDIELLEALPNFNWKVFTKISGINKPK